MAAAKGDDARKLVGRGQRAGRVVRPVSDDQPGAARPQQAAQRGGLKGVRRAGPPGANLAADAARHLARLVLRSLAITHRPPPVSFCAVTLATTFVLFVGWRVGRAGDPGGAALRGRLLRVQHRVSTLAGDIRPMAQLGAWRGGGRRVCRGGAAAGGRRGVWMG